MRRPPRFIPALMLICASVVACSDSTGPGGDLEDEFTIRGTVTNRTQADIPAGARVLIAWVVSATSPDYTYVFGEGSIDRDDATFEIVLDAPPPSAALNTDLLGVGIVVVTTSGGIANGDDIGDPPDGQIIGAAGDFGVIFIADPAAAEQLGGWVADFDGGYGVGVGGPENQGGFESFVPSGPGSVELIIDDLENISFVNWT